MHFLRYKDKNRLRREKKKKRKDTLDQIDKMPCTEAAQVIEIDRISMFNTENGNPTKDKLASFDQ